AVPMHSSKLAARGFNQAEILANWLSRDLGIPRGEDGVAKLVLTPSQTKLSRAARAQNLERTFSWRLRRPPPERVLLVDDIYTTGATLEAVAQSLRQAGTYEVFGWTLFRTPRLISHYVS